MTLKYDGKNISTIKYDGATFSSGGKLTPGTGLGFYLPGLRVNGKDPDLPEMKLVGVQKNLSNVNGIAFEIFSCKQTGYDMYVYKQTSAADSPDAIFTMSPGEYGESKPYAFNLGARSGTFKLVNLDTEPTLTFTGEISIMGIYVYAL